MSDIIKKIGTVLVLEKSSDSYGEFYGGISKFKIKEIES